MNWSQSWAYKKVRLILILTLYYYYHTSYPKISPTLISYFLYLNGFMHNCFWYHFTLFDTSITFDNRNKNILTILLNLHHHPLITHTHINFYYCYPHYIFWYCHNLSINHQVYSLFIYAHKTNTLTNVSDIYIHILLYNMNINLLQKKVIETVSQLITMIITKIM